jgi:hypothetical protein
MGSPAALTEGMDDLPEPGTSALDGAIEEIEPGEEEVIDEGSDDVELPGTDDDVELGGDEP